ncbi:uncharacterized protein LOC132716773 [Ruditapes philippinarum]|uniref:uncharacterized protein LOC132716773 n=1 Tax=Ruditapes philippinarum TaxID=129788 RepID=UPI00295BD00E|nr:uncharacterized protein LOC132716773 [Ruditapes philippinarum]
MKRKYKQILLKFCFIVIFVTIGISVLIRFTLYDKSHLIIHKFSKEKRYVVTTTPVIVSTSGKQHELTEKNKPGLKRPIVNNINNISESAKSDKIQQLPQEILSRFLQLPNDTYVYKICILSPVRNAATSLTRFGVQVGKLSYPPHLISLYFGEDGSTDDTFEVANRTAYNLRKLKKFNSAYAVKLNISGGYQGKHRTRHEQDVQEHRRTHMALARNRLFRFALRQKKFDYVLWIDSDIAELPDDLIQQMLFAKSDVVATCCLMRSMGYKMKYDRNSWRETNASRNYQSQLEPDALVLEGYSKTLRIHLPDLKSEGRIVELDGVGGCALMIKADCHRSGLHFPEVVYKHHIETEGLAKLAHDMGYNVVGLPFVEVFHV